jgi:hypothetical protein
MCLFGILEKKNQTSNFFSFQFCNLENLVSSSKNLAKLVQKFYARKEKLPKKNKNWSKK